MFPDVALVLIAMLLKSLPSVERSIEYFTFGAAVNDTTGLAPLTVILTVVGAIAF